MVDGDPNIVADMGETLSVKHITDELIASKLSEEYCISSVRPKPVHTHALSVATPQHVALGYHFTNNARFDSLCIMHQGK